MPSNMSVSFAACASSSVCRSLSCAGVALLSVRAGSATVPDISASAKCAVKLCCRSGGGGLAGGSAGPRWNLRISSAFRTPSAVAKSIWSASMMSCTALPALLAVRTAVRNAGDSPRKLRTAGLPGGGAGGSGSPRKLLYAPGEYWPSAAVAAGGCAGSGCGSCCTLSRACISLAVWRSTSSSAMMSLSSSEICNPLATPLLEERFVCTCGLLCGPALGLRCGAGLCVLVLYDSARRRWCTDMSGDAGGSILRSRSDGCPEYTRLAPARSFADALTRLLSVIDSRFCR